MLTSLLIIPILGVLALSPMQDGSAEQESRMKQIALFVTLLNFIVLPNTLCIKQVLNLITLIWLIIK